MQLLYVPYNNCMVPVLQCYVGTCMVQVLQCVCTCTKSMVQVLQFYDRAYVH